MRSYSVRDVERVLQLAPSATRGLIRAGFVKPARGPRREYRFSFQDLIVLRTARGLMQAKIPKKRIRRALESLRRNLPESMPLSGLAISAVGDNVVVRDGDMRWQADSGQYLLGLDVTLQDGVLQVVEHKPPAPEPSAPPPDWFAQALTLEGSDPEGAIAAYRLAVTVDPHDAAAWTNWGRLLHERGKIREANDVYRRALAQVGRDPLLLFNQGVLFEDLGKDAAALTAYQTALEEDPDLADCHYNIARLYEALGKPQHAIRHLGRYRRLLSGDTR
ncbi:MAG TPA: tetratricopeptide repeat protein [Steroidobacteraceae bacterium]|nr:tetratricopeptide repeat protein [Steroidobacteraceae bacterium]